MARSQTRFERMALRAIADLFPSDQYATIPQVPDATGFDRVRTADALVFSLWPSRGLTIEGIEIKASRGDLVKELRNPAKTEGMARFCHYWTVAARKGVCPDPDELPKPWGLIEWDESGGELAAVRVKMPKLLPVKPKHDMGFICGLARAISAECWSPSDLEQIKKEAYEKGREDQRQYVAYEVQDLRRLQERVAKFTEASGVDLEREWNDGHKIGEAYKLALTLVHEYHAKLAPLKRMIEAVEKELGGLTPRVVEPLPKRRKGNNGKR